MCCTIRQYSIPTSYQGWGQVQYLYLVLVLKYIVIVLDVLEYLVYGNVKVFVLVLDQKVLGKLVLSMYFQLLFIKKTKRS